MCGKMQCRSATQVICPGNLKQQKEKKKKRKKREQSATSLR